jgi:hypothetical protein
VDNLGKKCTINQFITIGQPWGTYWQPYQKKYTSLSLASCGVSPIVSIPLAH